MLQNFLSLITFNFTNHIHTTPAESDIMLSSQQNPYRSMSASPEIHLPSDNSSAEMYPLLPEFLEVESGYSLTMANDGAHIEDPTPRQISPSQVSRPKKQHPSRKPKPSVAYESCLLSFLQM